MKLYHVTEVLSVYNDFSFVAPGVLKEAQRRGTMVHNAAAAYAAGAFVVPVEAIYQGYFNSLKAWIDQFVDRVFFVEKRIRDREVYGITGMMDLGCRMVDGREVIVDWKTAVAESKTWKCQLAAYRYLAHKHYGHWFEVMALRPDINGKLPKASRYEFVEEDWLAFVHALSAYRYLKG